MSYFNNNLKGFTVCPSDYNKNLISEKEMTSNLSQFHFLASTVPNKFDFEEESFDVSQVYQFYSLKVSITDQNLSVLTIDIL